MGRASGTTTEEQLQALPVYQQSSVFSRLEKLVLDYAVVITKTPAEVPDELFAKLRQHFNEAQLVELTATIAWENYRARFNRSFGIESQNFSEHAYCPMPESAVKD